MTLSDCFESNGSEWEDILMNSLITNNSDLEGLNLGIAGSGSGRKISITFVNGVEQKSITESNPKKRKYNTAYVGPKNFNMSKIE